MIRADLARAFDAGDENASIRLTGELWDHPGFGHSRRSEYRAGGTIGLVTSGERQVSRTRTRVAHATPKQQPARVQRAEPLVDATAPAWKLGRRAAAEGTSVVMTQRVREQFGATQMGNGLEVGGALWGSYDAARDEILITDLTENPGSVRFGEFTSRTTIDPDFIRARQPDYRRAGQILVADWHVHPGWCGDRAAPSGGDLRGWKGFLQTFGPDRRPMNNNGNGQLPTRSSSVQKFDLVIVFVKPDGARIGTQGPWPVSMPVPYEAREHPQITVGGHPAMWVDCVVEWNGERRRSRFPLPLGEPGQHGGTHTLTYHVGATSTHDVEFRSDVRKRLGLDRDGEPAPIVTKRRYSTPRDGEIVVCGRRQVNW
jgi:hypothetical protein